MIVSSISYIDVTLKYMEKLAFAKWQYMILVTMFTYKEAHIEWVSLIWPK